jgi:hypothetical protein
VQIGMSSKAMITAELALATAAGWKFIHEEAKRISGWLALYGKTLGECVVQVGQTGSHPYYHFTVYTTPEEYAAGQEAEIAALTKGAESDESP